MKSQAEILREVRSLEAYFAAGLQRATGLRRELEGSGSPAPGLAGLAEKDKADLIAGRLKRMIQKKPQR